MDTRALEAWMDRNDLGTGPIEDLEPIGGGTQNRVLRFRRGSEEYVLRCGPLHPRPETDETIRREVRVVGALQNTGVPVPRILAAEGDPGEMGFTFYVMAPVIGHPIGSGLDLLDADSVAKHRLGPSMVEGLVRLATVDPYAVGLDDFGRPEGFLERQVARWSRQLESYDAFSGYPGPGVDVAPLQAWLAANVPHDGRIGVMHGDFHIGNVLFAPTGEVEAIVDWELATLGDPLIDFAELLITWPRPGETQGFAGIVPPERAEGFASVSELIACYEAGADGSLDDLNWYLRLSAYRLAVLLEGTHARATAGLARADVGQLLHESAYRLLTVACDAIDGAGGW
jgi:aminoglycoside phosphotransferase (APT) family kinase protein